MMKKAKTMLYIIDSGFVNDAKKVDNSKLNLIFFIGTRPGLNEYWN